MKGDEGTRGVNGEKSEQVIKKGVNRKKERRGGKNFKQY